MYVIFSGWSVPREKKHKIPQETGLHNRYWVPDSTERKTVSVTKLFVASKEEQHQSLQHIH